jgi:nucleotide-binding universal stress UspA family protein
MDTQAPPGAGVSEPRDSTALSILLYYDGSDEAKHALRRAADLALPHGGALHVLTVAQTLPAIAASAGMLSDLAYGHLLDCGWRTLDEAVATLSAHGALAQGHLAHGPVVESIAKQAALVDADMIVIGLRHRRSFARWWQPDPTLDQVARRAEGRTVVAVPMR